MTGKELAEGPIFKTDLSQPTSILDRKYHVKKSVEPWVLDDVIPMLRHLENALKEVGWHAALAGGVLYKGQSTHDLDVVVFPHNVSEVSYARLVTALTEFGWTLDVPRHAVQWTWARRGSTDTKHVEVWRTLDGRRVDVIILR